VEDSMLKVELLITELTLVNLGLKLHNLKVDLEKKAFVQECLV
jgi:hypothetical protein